ncbi:MAG: ribosome maturation factor RimP [Thermodesulfobacteriota bacterium]
MAKGPTSGPEGDFEPRRSRQRRPSGKYPGVKGGPEPAAETPPARKMKPREVEELVARLAGPSVAARGLELVAVQYRPEAGGLILRITLDGPDGISVEDCAFVSRAVDAILEERFSSDHPFRLEVSSPGPERPLVTMEHFDRFLGRRARVKTRSALEGRTTFTGVIKSVKEQTVFLECDLGLVPIALSEIAAAKLCRETGEASC